MTKSQNTKNEQQKDLCITNEQLTEQWKKGDLVSGISYYVEDTNGYINALEYIDAGVDSHFSIRESVIKRIIAPVPSYEEWIGVKQQRDLENKLRHDSDNKNWQLRTENAQLREQLSIALEALDKVAIYMTCDENEMREIYPDFCADQAALDAVNEAMDKIKELKQDDKNSK